jgi:ribosomal protein S1
MTNAETPTDNSTAGAPEPAAQVEPSAAPAHSDAARGEPVPAAPAAAAPSEGDGGEGGDEGEGQSPAGAEAQPGQTGHAGPAGEKKKRRRRRKKKPHDGPHEPGAEARPAGTGDEASAEPAQPTDENAAPKLREHKKKEKKHGPPRERPPVNAGDIVFGKIIEITDEAILIDIPGKAKAIFDRRELLLADDDEQPGRRPHGAVDEVPPIEGSTDTAAQASAEVSEGGPAPLEGSEATAAVHYAAADTSSSSTAAATEPTSEAPSEPEPPREPKVPRVTLEVGADFIAVVHNDGARGGYVVLTHHPHRAERAKPVVEKAFNDKTTIEGLVTGVIKGGVEVDVDGLRAFVPGSHIDMRLGTDLSYLVAQRLPFVVTQYAKRGRDLVLSRKAMIEEEAKKARTDALARLKIGEEIEGTVRSVVSFGAFVDVGGIEGLVPLQEMSHNRGDGPNEVFKAGEPTRVKVLKIDERGKVWLSHKATISDPWDQVAQKYAQGTRHSGKVARLQPFGAFIELESGVDGLIHLADLSVNRIESPSEVVKVGDPIEVVVSHVDPSSHKIALHPAPTGDAANETPQRVQPHKPVKAKIVNIETGGVVVRILGVTGRNSRGYITSAGTGTPRGTELRKVFKIGQEVEAKVIEMDPRRGEVKLSIKALSEELERSAYQQYRQQVKAEARFTFADLLTKKGTPPQR